MSVVAANLVAKVSVEGAAQAKTDLQDVSKSVSQTSGGFKSMLGNALSLIPTQAVFNAVGNAIGFLKNQAVDSVKIAIQHQQVMAQTAQAIKSTGDASGMTASQIDNLSTSLSGVTTFSKDAIQTGQNLLLTFTGIGKKTFPDATKAMLDLSQATGQSLTSSAMQLGKALNDPLTGMAALQRVGVSFSATEKEQIKTMMAHNDVAGAQKVMLNELATEFGGSAQAAGKTLGGALTIVKNKLNDVKEKIATDLLPSLTNLMNKFADPVLQLIPKMFDDIGNAGKYVWDVLRSINLTGFRDAWSTVRFEIGYTVKAFENLFGSLDKVSGDFDPLANTIAGFAKGGLNLLTNLLWDVSGAFISIDKATQEGQGPLVQVMSVFKSALPVIESIAQTVGQYLVIAFKQYGEEAKMVAPIVGQIFSGLFSLLGPVISSIKTQLLPALQNMYAAINPIVQAIAKWVVQSNLIPAVFTVIKTVLTVVIGVISGLITGITAVIKFFTQTQIGADLLKAILITLGIVFGVIALSIGVLVITALPGLIAGFAATAIGALAAGASMVIAFAPIVLPILAIIAVIAGVIFAIQHWGQIVDWLKGVWSAISGFFQKLWNDVLGFFQKFGLDIIEVLIGPIGLIIHFWQPITDFFKKIWNDIYTALKPVIDFIVAVFQTLWNIIVAIFGKVGNWFHDRWTEVWNAIVAVFSPIGRWFQDRWNDIVKVFSVTVAYYKKVFTDAWNMIVTIFTPVGRWFGDRWNDIVHVFSVTVAFYKKVFTDAWNAIVAVFTPIGHWFGDRWNDIMNGVNSFKTSITNKFTDTKNGVIGIFKGMMNGIIDELNNGIGAVESFINFFGQGLDNVAKALGTTGNIPVAHLNRIPHLATGTDFHQGGPALVGEEGPELVMLPRGTSVLPNKQTMGLLSGSTPGYASGSGNPLADLWQWITQGAKSIVDHIVSALNIHTPKIGNLTNVASGIFNKVESWAVGFVGNLLPKFGGGDGSGGGGSAGQSNASGTVMSWIMQAIGLTGAPASWANDLAIIAMHESGGNPRAVNLSDINAQEGHPSEGLMQTIISTFMAHALPGHTDVWNPVDNAAAAIGYIRGRYGSVFNVPGIVSMTHGGPYQGYANGTSFAPGGGGWVGENGPEYMYIPRGAQITPNHALNTINPQQQQQGQPIFMQVDGNTFARLIMPYVITEVRNSVGIRGL